MGFCVGQRDLLQLRVPPIGGVLGMGEDGLQVAGPPGGGQLSSVLWAELTWQELGAARADDPVVIFPVGSLEQHGPHLPVSVDTVNAYEVSVRTARHLAGRVPVLVLPPLWYGFSVHHMAFAGTVTLRSETFVQVVEDVVDAVVSHGFRRVVVFNGHGGNVYHLGVAAQRLGGRHAGKAYVVGLTYWHLVAHRTAEFRTTPEGGMGHACEFETSLQMVLAPGLVHPDRFDATYVRTVSPRYMKVDLFANSPIASYVDFRALSPLGTFGDPGAASVEKGKRILQILVEELGRFVEDFRRWPIYTGSTAQEPSDTPDPAPRS